MPPLSPASTSSPPPASATSTGSSRSGMASGSASGRCWIARAARWSRAHSTMPGASTPSCAGRRLPGGSRHHWGTDVDVIDAAALPPDYRVQLVPEEYAPGGVFERLTPWLDANMARFGFYRPYATGHGGARRRAVAPELLAAVAERKRSRRSPCRCCAAPSPAARSSGARACSSACRRVYTRFILGGRLPGAYRRTGFEATPSSPPVR